MANQDHETRASHAVGVWNKWRDENPGVAPDLSGAKLSKGLHTKRKLFGANLAGADLSGADMRGAFVERKQLLMARWNKATQLPAEHRGLTPLKRKKLASSTTKRPQVAAK